MQRELHDHYFKLAKREGYLSRAAYKLIEIDDRRNVLAKGDRVLDCGCAPGSWVQVAAQRVGPNGCVLGIDLQAVEHHFHEDNVRIVRGDLVETSAEALSDGAAFDVVLSDMAPSTSGDRSIDHHGSVRLCLAVLDRCPALLRSGGNAVIKIFEGEAYPDVLERMKSLFEKVRGFKPKASRSDSTEMYLIGHGYRSGSAQQSKVDEVRATLPSRKPKPKSGWKRS